MPILPPEAWTAIGVAIGGAATAFFAWLGRFGEMRSQRQKVKLDYQQAQIAALRDEITVLKATVKAVEESARTRQEEAYRIQDRARLALSMAISHINLLNSHIARHTPPPAPPIPADLARYIEALLWSAPININDAPTQQPPRSPPGG